MRPARQIRQGKGKRRKNRRLQKFTPGGCRRHDWLRSWLKIQLNPTTIDLLMCHSNGRPYPTLDPCGSGYFWDGSQPVGYRHTNELFLEPILGWWIFTIDPTDGTDWKSLHPITHTESGMVDEGGGEVNLFSHPHHHYVPSSRNAIPVAPRCNSINLAMGAGYWLA